MYIYLHMYAKRSTPLTKPEETTRFNKIQQLRKTTFCLIKTWNTLWSNSAIFNTIDMTMGSGPVFAFPLPSAGFSHNSVLLNLYHVLSFSKNQRIGQSKRLRFPWMPWHLWKARNSFCFEQRRFSAATIYSKAAEESSIWFKLIQKDQEE